MLHIRYLLGGMVVPGVMSLCALAQSPTTLPGSSAPATVLQTDSPGVVVHPPAPALPLSLESARKMAVERQAAVIAARVSLHAATLRRDAIVALRVPTFLARDLPIRKQQADLGVSVAEAEVQLTEINASYAAAYCYLSYLYALDQEKVASDAIAGLTELRKNVLEKLGDEGKKPVDQLSRENRKRILQIDTYLNIAQARRSEARSGAERALSALREAIGLPPDAPLHFERKGLPEINLGLEKKILIDLALKRRPEIAQAQLGVEVSSLETRAQATPALFAFRVNTFASASDIHSKSLPIGVFENEYRPGAIGPEMPVTINGYKHHRVAQAEALTSRAGTLLERTQKLITLETEQAYLRWVDGVTRLKSYRDALKTSIGRVEELRSEIKEDVNITEELIASGAVASQIRVDINRARLDVLLSLAQLERVTVGGFCARFDDASSPTNDVEQYRREAERVIKSREKK